MADQLHLQPKHRQMLASLLRKHLPQVEVWAYGSRVNGRSHDGSDLDLVLRGPGLRKIPVARLADFEEAVRESNIPFLVEARDWARLPERFHREIEQAYVVLESRPTPTHQPKGWLYRPHFPAHWSRCPLDTMAEWVNGLAFSRISFSSCGMPVIKIAEIKGGISGQTKFTQQTFDEPMRVRTGDLLFSWSGQPETSIDAFWWRGPEGWLNQHVFRVTPRDGIDRTFFYYLLRYLKPNFVSIARNKQTTGLGHVTRRDMASIEAAAPSIAEQRAIARILGTLDDRVELNRCMSETLEAMTQALFKSWFVDFEPVQAKVNRTSDSWLHDVCRLFPNSYEESPLGHVPCGWKVVELTELIDVNPRRPSLRKGETAPYVPMSSMPTAGHTPSQISSRPFGSGVRFINGDTLVARITPSLENGKTAYVNFLMEGQVGWGSTEYIVLRPKPFLPSEFAYCLARSVGFRDFAIQSMTGTSGRQRVQPTALSQFLMPHPPERVGKEFGRLTRPLISRARLFANESRTLADLRDVLLPKLVSGEIRIADAEKAAEAVA